MNPRRLDRHFPLRKSELLSAAFFDHCHGQDDLPGNEKLNNSAVRVGFVRDKPNPYTLRQCYRSSKNKLRRLVTLVWKRHGLAQTGEPITVDKYCYFSSIFKSFQFCPLPPYYVSAFR